MRVNLIKDLELSVRANSRLESLGVTTVSEITGFTVDDFLRIKGIGFASVLDILKALHREGWIKATGSKISNYKWISEEEYSEICNKGILLKHEAFEKMMKNESVYIIDHALSSKKKVCVECNITGIKYKDHNKEEVIVYIEHEYTTGLSNVFGSKEKCLEKIKDLEC